MFLGDAPFGLDAFDIVVPIIQRFLNERYQKRIDNVNPLFFEVPPPG